MLLISSSTDAKKPTVYDGIASVEGGTQSLSTNVSSYVSAVNNTYYWMIKNDPASTQLLKNYEAGLKQVQAAYAKAVGDDQKQYAQQIQVLSNLIALYTAGTDSSVTNETQFETRLVTLAGENNANQNVVSSGEQIAVGAKQLSSASQQIATQFNNGGAFKEGMQKIANGTSKLDQSMDGLSALQSGNKKLADSLSQLSDGSNKLLAGAKNLQSGISSAEEGSTNLLDGSNKLVDANSKINDGATKLTSGVGLTSQKKEIETVMNQIQENKNEKISDAFDHVFSLAAIILVVASVCGLFTDKKEEH